MSPFRILPAALGLIAALCAAPVLAASWPTQEGDFTLKDFRFQDGETLPALHLHYMTLGQPHRNARGEIDNAVFVMHGTGGSGKQFLSPQFADELYGPGQPLDITKTYVILPDEIGHGGSSKPSDGLHARFPHYDYDDMVAADYRLLTEHLGVKHLRLVMGTSMGCMHSFVMAEAHPDFVSAAMPLACLPVQIAGRNRIWRRMIVEAIKADPAWNNGEYAREPLEGLRTAEDMLIIAGSAPIQMQIAAPTRDKSDAYLDAAMAKSLPKLDANDLIYQVDSSRNYDPEPGLSRIVAPVMWVNSADDFINPPDLGIAQKEAPKIKRGRFVLIPASDKTHGHGTHTWAAVWEPYMVQLLAGSAGSSSR